MSKDKNSFTARTRIYNTIDYYRAKWQARQAGGFNVEFLEGPNRGKSFQDKRCVIALDEAWKKNKVDFEGIL